MYTWVPVCDHFLRSSGLMTRHWSFLDHVYPGDQNLSSFLCLHKYTSYDIVSKKYDQGCKGSMCSLSQYDYLYLESLYQYLAELLIVYSMNETCLPFAFDPYLLGNFFSTPFIFLPMMSLVRSFKTQKRS